jgi:hypothetical protein
VCPIGPNGGRDDDRERGPDAELHAHRLGDLENAEDFVQDRNDHGTAAHAEQSGEKASGDAGDANGDAEPDQFA